MSFQYHLDQIDQAVDFLEERIESNIICFDGPMGGGKTTLISRLCQKWEVVDTVSSPTFSIINHYNSLKKGIIYHFDFYRLESINEALDIGTEEYLDAGKYCLIEWGNRIEPLLPPHYTLVKIQFDTDQKRSINIVNK
jgi:tRNA threonylcarbamoyladenosine biosynthesis protein TsaE